MINLKLNKADFHRIATIKVKGRCHQFKARYNQTQKDVTIKIKVRYHQNQRTLPSKLIGDVTLKIKGG